MIRAVIFDLDGTLVQTERLKAIAYGRAAVELCPRTIAEDDVVEAYKSVVGRSRQEVAEALVERFGLCVSWEELVERRLKIYDGMVADPELIKSKQWPHSVALLREASQSACRTALATMSHREQVRWILEVLELADAFDVVATADDVKRGKPDPEIYQRVSEELDIPPEGCLVIEDSPSGVKAALAAEMACIAVTTPFTREAVHAAGLLEAEWIVDDPEVLCDVVRRRLERSRQSSGG